MSAQLRHVAASKAKDCINVSSPKLNGYTVVQGWQKLDALTVSA